MAATQPQSRDQPSPGLTLSLSSNNPFRNRAGSPLPKSPASPFDDPAPQSLSLAQQPSRPLSTNPFLDPSKQPASSATADLEPLITMADEKDNTLSKTEDIFASLSLDSTDKDKPTSPPVKSPPGRPGAPRGPPPPGRRGPPPPGHRSMGSRERRPNGPPGPNSPPRRMASSSGSGRPSRPLTDEEQKARDQRRRERERRDPKGKKMKSHRDADLIDKLDETNPFGGRVHHGGPYDAIISARNKSKNAPVHAFAKDSANMSMGGSGPLNARPDHSTFMGNGTEDAFSDYSTGISIVPPTKKDLTMFDPHMRAAVVHGDETQGLGTSTFLEGTPAAKAAVEKAEQENAATMAQDGGLSRKKSLAQRIRGINRPQRGGFAPSGRMTNPDAMYRDRERGSSGSMTSPRGESNPFFAEFEESKGGEEQISVRKMSSGGAASPPLPGSLERRATTDALGGFEQPKPKTGGGLLGRMKSLKGGPRSRPEKDPAA